MNSELSSFTKYANARTPSHLVSKIQFGSEKGSSTSVASMGLMIEGMRAARAAEHMDDLLIGDFFVAI